MRERFERRLPWIAVAVVVLGFVNGLALFVVSIAIGGDALNGQVTDGRYYVMSHGTLTEVSQAVWIASRVHTLVTFISFPAVMLAMAFVLFRYAFPFLMSGKAPGQAAERVSALRASGQPVWRGSPGGLMGDISASAGMLGAEVYPDGIVVAPRFMAPSAILASEIRSVQLGRRLRTSTIVVEHAGIDLMSPLVLYGGPDSSQARVLLAIASGDMRDLPLPVPPAPAGGPVPGWPAPSAATTRKAPGPMRILRLLGVLAPLAMLVAGVLFVIPSVGPLGFIWTGMALLILVVNGRSLVRGS